MMLLLLYAAGVLAEGDAALLLADVLQVLHGGPHLHALEGLGGLVGVLVVDAEVHAHGLNCF